MVTGYVILLPLLTKDTSKKRDKKALRRALKVFLFSVNHVLNFRTKAPRFTKGITINPYCS